MRDLIQIGAGSLPKDHDGSQNCIKRNWETLLAYLWHWNFHRIVHWTRTEFPMRIVFVASASQLTEQLSSTSELQDLRIDWNKCKYTEQEYLVIKLSILERARAWFSCGAFSSQRAELADLKWVFSTSLSNLLNKFIRALASRIYFIIGYFTRDFLARIFFLM